MTFKEHIFSLVDENNKSNSTARFFDSFIATLVVLNIIALVLSSFEEIDQQHHNSLYYFEVFSVIVFTIEHFMRLYTADLIYRDKKYWHAFFKYSVTPMAIIDLLAVLPFYLPYFFGVNFTILRVFRVLRLLKLSRYSKSLKLLVNVFRLKRFEIGITLFITGVLLIISATLIYSVEGHIQPEAFPNIVASLWWAIITLTTVGYGDVVPITGVGKLIGGIVSLLGIGLVALPTSILSAAFVQQMNKEKEDKKEELAGKEAQECPHCGRYF